MFLFFDYNACKDTILFRDKQLHKQKSRYVLPLNAGFGK